jgi:cell division protein FtsQ
MTVQGWVARLQHSSIRGRSRSTTRQRPRVRLVLGTLVIVILLGGGWLWLRDSTLVTVRHVSVSGESGPDAGRIRSALVTAARNMTTLHVRMDQLRMAVAPFPIVRDLRVMTQFPHGIRIHVVERIPVGAVVVSGRTTAVAGDGTLLHDVTPAPDLPSIPVRVTPGGARLSEPNALAAVALLAAAPSPMLERISQVTTIASHGLVAQLRTGPSIYFGDSRRFAAKWIAVTSVLADAGSAGALYIDVTDPERPAAGSGSPGTSSQMGG